MTFFNVKKQTLNECRPRARLRASTATARVDTAAEPINTAAEPIDTAAEPSVWPTRLELTRLCLCHQVDARRIVY